MDPWLLHVTLCIMVFPTATYTFCFKVLIALTLSLQNVRNARACRRVHVGDLLGVSKWVKALLHDMKWMDLWQNLIQLAIADEMSDLPI